MEQQPPLKPGPNIRLPETLGDEEEAWYRPRPNNDSVAAIKVWLRTHSFTCNSSGNPLEDDEDAWARR